MTALVIMIGLLAASAEFLGGFLLARRTAWPARVQLYLLALGAGFMLSLVFLKLIPTAFGLVAGEAFFLVLLGYALLHFFEHTIVGHFHFGEEVHEEAMTSKIAGLSAFSGLVRGRDPHLDRHPASQISRGVDDGVDHGISKVLTIGRRAVLARIEHRNDGGGPRLFCPPGHQRCVARADPCSIRGNVDLRWRIGSHPGDQ